MRMVQTKYSYPTEELKQIVKKVLFYLNLQGRQREMSRSLFQVENKGINNGVKVKTKQKKHLKSKEWLQITVCLMDYKLF